MQFSNSLIEQLKADGFGITPQRYPEVFKRQKRRSKRHLNASKTIFKGGFVINRYPIMVALAFCVAKKCGYSLKLSKSMAVAVATNYAILKNVGGGFCYGKNKGKKTLDEQIFNSPENLKEFETKMFCGCELIIKDDLVIGLARVRGKQTPFYPEKFDWQMSKLDNIKKGGSKFLMQAINKKLNKQDINELAEAPFASRGHGYFVFWKQIRDKMRQRAFWFKD